MDLHSRQAEDRLRVGPSNPHLTHDLNLLTAVNSPQQEGWAISTLSPTPLRVDWALVSEQTAFRPSGELWALDSQL